MDNNFVQDDKIMRIKNSNKNFKNKARDKMKQEKREERRFGKNR